MTWVLHVARKTNAADSSIHVHIRERKAADWRTLLETALNFTWFISGAIWNKRTHSHSSAEATAGLPPTLRKICNWESSKYQQKLSRWRTVTHPKIKLSITLILNLSHGNKNSWLLHMKDLSPWRFFFDPRLIHVAIKHNNLINTRNKCIKFHLLHVSA